MSAPLVHLEHAYVYDPQNREPVLHEPQQEQCGYRHKTSRWFKSLAHDKTVFKVQQVILPLYLPALVDYELTLIPQPSPADTYALAKLTPVAIPMNLKDVIQSQSIVQNFLTLMDSDEQVWGTRPSALSIHIYEEWQRLFAPVNTNTESMELQWLKKKAQSTVITMLDFIHFLLRESILDEMKLLEQVPNFMTLAGYFMVLDCPVLLRYYAHGYLSSLTFQQRRRLCRYIQNESNDYTAFFLHPICVPNHEATRDPLAPSYVALAETALSSSASSSSVTIQPPMTRSSPMTHETTISPPISLIFMLCTNTLYECRALFKKRLLRIADAHEQYETLLSIWMYDCMNQDLMLSMAHTMHVLRTDKNALGWWNKFSVSYRTGGYENGTTICTRKDIGLIHDMGHDLVRFMYPQHDTGALDEDAALCARIMERLVRQKCVHRIQGTTSFGKTGVFFVLNTRYEDVNGTCEFLLDMQVRGLHRSKAKISGCMPLRQLKATNWNLDLRQELGERKLTYIKSLQEFDYDKMDQTQRRFAYAVEMCPRRIVLLNGPGGSGKTFSENCVAGIDSRIENVDDTKDSSSSSSSSSSTDLSVDKVRSDSSSSSSSNSNSSNSKRSYNMLMNLDDRLFDAIDMSKFQDTALVGSSEPSLKSSRPDESKTEPRPILDTLDDALFALVDLRKFESHIAPMHNKKIVTTTTTTTTTTTGPVKTITIPATILRLTPMNTQKNTIIQNIGHAMTLSYFNKFCQFNDYQTIFREVISILVDEANTGDEMSFCRAVNRYIRNLPAFECLVICSDVHQRGSVMGGNVFGDFLACSNAFVSFQSTLCHRVTVYSKFIFRVVKEINNGVEDFILLLRSEEGRRCFTLYDNALWASERLSAHSRVYYDALAKACLEDPINTQCIAYTNNWCDWINIKINERKKHWGDHIPRDAGKLKDPNNNTALAARSSSSSSSSSSFFAPTPAPPSIEDQYLLEQKQVEYGRPLPAFMEDFRLEDLSRRKSRAMKSFKTNNEVAFRNYLETNELRIRNKVKVTAPITALVPKWFAHFPDYDMYIKANAKGRIVLESDSMYIVREFVRFNRQNYTYEIFDALNTPVENAITHSTLSSGSFIVMLQPITSQTADMTRAFKGKPNPELLINDRHLWVPLVWKMPYLMNFANANCITVAKVQSMQFDHVFILMEAMYQRKDISTAIGRAKDHISLLYSDKRFNIEQSLSAAIRRLEPLRYTVLSILLPQLMSQAKYQILKYQ